MTELLVLNVAQKVTPAVSLDGSRVHTLIDGLDEFLDGAVVDSQRGHIYWTNMGIRDPGAAEGTEPTFFTRNGSLERVDLEWPQPPHDCCPGRIHHRQAADRRLRRRQVVLVRSRSWRSGPTSADCF
jgi:hypothetical protein